MKLRIISVFLMLFTVGATLNSYSDSTLNSSADIYNRVSGIWGMEAPGLNCKSLPSEYKFGDRNKTMSITSNKNQPMHDGTTREVVNYKVISSDDSSITLAMENETRANKNGELALWKIVLVNNNTFYWQISGDPQTQWGPVVRCINQK